MDLIKAFDAIHHGLLLTKLYTYGISKDACKMIRSYLINRMQRVKLDYVRSSWKCIMVCHRDLKLVLVFLTYYHVIFDIKISSYFIMQTCHNLFQVNKPLPYLNQLSASFVFNTDYQPPNQKGPHVYANMCNPT